MVGLSGESTSPPPQSRAGLFAIPFQRDTTCSPRGTPLFITLDESLTRPGGYAHRSAADPCGEQTLNFWHFNDSFRQCTRIEKGIFRKKQFSKHPQATAHRHGLLTSAAWWWSVGWTWQEIRLFVYVSEDGSKVQKPTTLRLKSFPIMYSLGGLAIDAQTPSTRKRKE